MKMSKDIVLEVICFLFIILFAYAATSKLLTYEKFEVQIGQSPLLTGFGKLIAPGVIGVEFVLCIALLFKVTRKIGLIASFMLMTMFTVYILAILVYSPYTPCSCGGILEAMGWTEHLIFNIGFVAIAAFGVIIEFRKSTTQIPKSI